MVPTPVWKSSYRLIFGEGAQPTIEGWAIVDNTTGEDWNKVDLSLVSGRPISFISRLYEPRYVTRQTAELPEDFASAPVVYEGAMADSLVGTANGTIDGQPPPPPPPLAKFKPSAGLSGREQLREFTAPSTIVAPAAARELGELFEYHIPTPVTVHRNESAMLPFLQQKVDTRKLLIYSDPPAAHPMDAAEISNSTGKTLDGGPITVYEAGSYAGEALMETVKTGDKRLISYGVDLGTRIATQWDSQAEQIREIHARRGILTTRNAVVETRTYTIRNVDQKAKTLVIEHAARPEYNLLDRKPTEKTSNAYRFEVKLAPGATEKFPVTEERVYERAFVITDLTPDVLSTYVRNKTFSDAGRKQLEQIGNLKQQITAAGREIQSLDSQINEVIRDQERLRQNIGSLNQVSGQQQQVQTYAQRLASQESQLASLRDRRAELDKKRAGFESEVSGAIESMVF
jgi:regulator of replication initiation timing